MKVATSCLRVLVMVAEYMVVERFFIQLDVFAVVAVAVAAQ